MKQILESIENYTASLEQRLAALESTVAVLQTQLSLAQAKNGEQENRIASLEARIATLEEELNNIEWVTDEEIAEPAAQPQPETPQPAPVQEPQEEVKEVIEEQQEVVKEVIEEEPSPSAPEQSGCRDDVHIVSIQEAPAPEAPIQEEQTAAPEQEESAPAPTKEASVYGKPVDDIKQAIALGDRFLFQRELFRQNAEQMQRTFMDINALHSFDEAVAYLDKRFDWDKDSNTYALFLTALHRRFPQ